MKFSEFGFNDQLLESIASMGYDTATPIQEKAIPVILEGKDILGSAQTGTGKTAAFLLPVIQKLTGLQHDGSVKALIVVPTRELAIQIDQQMQGLSYFTGVSAIAVYGGTDGTSFAREKQALTVGTDVVIGTPGRLMAHLNMGYVKAAGLRFLVLDEADRMLDMGFYDDIMKIISYLPEKRQNLLFAATMPPKIKKLAEKVLSKPVEVNIAVSKPAEKVLQVAYMVYEKQKIPLVKYLLHGKQLRSILVFCSTKSKTKQVRSELRKQALSTDEIHSDLEQAVREKVLNDFKSRKTSILVATDILSRGIDVEDINLVINYDVPGDPEDYIHRIGRTARAESDGVAITFVSEDDQQKFASIERFLEKPVMKLKLPPELGEAPDYSPRKPSRPPFRRNRSKRK